MTDNAMDLLGDLWGWNPLVSAAAAVLTLLALALLVVGIGRLIRGARGADSNMKLRAGTFVVQAGVTWAVVTGTYAFCTEVFHLPWGEAIAFAVFLEAATWVTVGMIVAHGRGTSEQGEPNTGFGPAGPFFFLFSVLCGTLAIVAGETAGAMIGRAVIVTFGTCLWYLTLLTYTRRSGVPSRFRWTPRRLLVALGAIEPADQDVTNEHLEWQIRRLARAMRWANSRPPLKWIGQRMLISRAEQTEETVIEAARRRYAVAHLLVTTVQPDSDVMKRVIASVKAEVVPTVANLVAAREASGPVTQPIPMAAPAPAPSAVAPAPKRTVESGSPTATERADAFILREWDRGTAVTGADVDRYCGTNPRNGLGRKRLGAMRKDHPEREPRSGNGNPAGVGGTADDYRPVNGHSVPELLATAAGSR